MKSLAVRRWAKIMPSWTWAVLLDSLDLLSLPFTIFPVLGEGVGLVIDTLQAMLAFLIFEDPLMWVAAGIEYALPQPLDIFPTFTARYILAQLG